MNPIPRCLAYRYTRLFTCGKAGCEQGVFLSRKAGYWSFGLVDEGHPALLGVQLNQVVHLQKIRGVSGVNRSGSGEVQRNRVLEFGDC
jgi:hypothetical protein